jgi:hypothetical protein
MMRLWELESLVAKRVEDLHEREGSTHDDGRPPRAARRAARLAEPGRVDELVRSRLKIVGGTRELRCEELDHEMKRRVRRRPRPSRRQRERGHRRRCVEEERPAPPRERRFLVLANA